MIVFEPAAAINQWVAAHGGGYAHPGSFTAMACIENQEIVGGLVFYDANGKNCLANIALTQKRFPRELVRAGLLYAFTQLALRRLTFVVSSANIPSQNLVRQLGATLEATLLDADPLGNTLIFALFRENCKLWSRFNGKIVGQPPAIS